jgi:hypothetical protein
LRFKFYDLIHEDANSSTAVTWTTATGPWVVDLASRGAAWFDRALTNADTWVNLALPLCVKTDDI